jgi:hypothetical protein
MSRLEWESLERVAVNLGLYSASGVIARQLWQRITLDQESLSTTRTLERSLLAALHWGQVEDATRLLFSLYPERHASERTLSRAVLEHYVGLASGLKESARGELGEETAFRRLVEGKRVLFYGPGPTDSANLKDSTFDIVVRTAGFGKYAFDSPADLVGNRVDIVYVNPEVIDEHTPEEALEAMEVLSSYSMVCSKRRLIPGLWNSRVSANISPLFLRGHPHKANQPRVRGN